MTSDKTLSQEEIDALLGGDDQSDSESPSAASILAASSTAPAPPPAAPAGPPRAVASTAVPSGPPMAAPTPAQNASGGDDLQAAMDKISQVELAVTEARLAIQQMPRLQQELQQAVQYMQTLGATVQGILDNLAASPTYGAQHNFTCTSCGTTGDVAVPVTCTKCGTQTWRGWWPQ